MHSTTTIRERFNAEFLSVHDRLRRRPLQGHEISSLVPYIVSCSCNHGILELSKNPPREQHYTCLWNLLKSRFQRQVSRGSGHISGPDLCPLHARRFVEVVYSRLQNQRSQVQSVLCGFLGWPKNPLAHVIIVRVVDFWVGPKIHGHKCN